MKYFVEMVVDEIERGKKYFWLVVGLMLATQSVSIGHKIFSRQHGEPIFARMLLDLSGNYVLIVGGVSIALLIYCFNIWIRDWRGPYKNIYRLMMIPTSRIAIPLSKITAVFFMILGAVAIQIIYMMGVNYLLVTTVSEYLGTGFLDTWKYSFSLTNIYAPAHLIYFVVSYLVGIVALLMVGNLMMYFFSETRGPRWMKYLLIVAGIGLTGAYVVYTAFAPFVIWFTVKELLIYQSVMIVVGLVVSLGLSAWITKKVLSV